MVRSKNQKRNEASGGIQEYEENAHWVLEFKNAGSSMVTTDWSHS
jgi:hypothetical protein